MITKKSGIACMVAISACAVAAIMTEVAVAQATKSEFTPSKRTCSDAIWRDDTLERYPNINIACMAIVERDGTEYVKFSGSVVQNSKEGLRLHFIPTGSVFDVYPADRELKVGLGEGRVTEVKDLKPKDDVRIYVPAGRLIKNYLSDTVEKLKEGKLGE